MDTASVVKERVADLVSHLEASRKAMGRLEQERHALQKQVENGKDEVRAAREQLLQDRRKRSEQHDEREALIRELEEDRRLLLRKLRSAEARLRLSEQHVEALTGQLERAEENRDAALGELGEAVSALADVRDQLRLTLRHVSEQRGVLDAGVEDDPV